jgi:hypothetical protein
MTSGTILPSDWKKLDENDEDLGGTNPIPLDVPAPNGSAGSIGPW